MSLADIKTMDQYLLAFGKILGHKATTTLQPLHVPNQDPLLDMGEFTRAPFEPQAHVITAAAYMMDSCGNGFISGECGTGKTIIGMCACHKHARGKPYRAVVLCPDHLIGKWAEEIEETIPGATTFRFDNWKGVAALIGKGVDVVKEDGKGRRTLRRHAKPLGPEWYILGRDQAKWLPKWLGISEPYRGFRGVIGEPISVKNLLVGRTPAVDELNRPILDEYGVQRKTPAFDKVFQCPRCGTVPLNKNGIALGANEIAKTQQRCKGVVLKAIHDPEEKVPYRGPDTIDVPPEMRKYAVPDKILRLGGVCYKATACNEDLFHYTSSPYRWPPARIIHKKCKRMFRYLIVDECHEAKSDEAARSMACGKLIASSRHVLAMTGTIIGGRADHLFPLMVRITPKTIRAEGFEWGKDLKFSEQYGKIDRIVTTKQDDGGTSIGKGSCSMRRVRTGKASERKAVRPGIMPSLFGNHLIGSSVFISLCDMTDELPNLDEFVADGACEMDPEQKQEYDRIERILVAESKELLKKGSMKLLGTMLATLLAYPDMPFKEEWEPEFEGEPAVGYWIKPRWFHPENWVGVVQPAGLDRDHIYPKERKLIDICKAEKAAGIQCWVYCQMTGKRDVQVRLKRLLEAEGLRVYILRSKTVKPIDRREWIERNGFKYDVVISFPRLVSTGLDLFSKVGSHNFSTLIFYETGYDTFTLVQAAARSCRIGQPRDCKVYYLYYTGGMQHRAMAHIALKRAAMQALNGDFSTEGLAAMAGDGDAQMAMARALSEKIDSEDMHRNWGKITGTRKPRPERERDALDELPIEVQLVAETILEHEPEPAVLKLVGVPPEPDAAVAAAFATVEAADEEEKEIIADMTRTMTRANLAAMFKRLMAAGDLE